MALQVLGTGEAATIKVIIRAMAAPGERNDSTDEEAVGVVDRFLTYMPVYLRFGFRFLIQAFDLLPVFFIFRPGRFSRLTDSERERYLSGWSTSRLMPRRAVYQALRKLSMLGFYSVDSELALIGYEPKCGK